MIIDQRDARIATLEADRAAATDLVAQQEERIATLEAKLEEWQGEALQSGNEQDNRDAEICERHSVEWNGADSICDVVTKLEAEIAELRADRDHLDWLEHSNISPEVAALIVNGRIWAGKYYDTLRAAIGAARKGQ